MQSFTEQLQFVCSANVDTEGKRIKMGHKSTMLLDLHIIIFQKLVIKHKVCFDALTPSLFVIKVQIGALLISETIGIGTEGAGGRGERKKGNTHQQDAQNHETKVRRPKEGNSSCVRPTQTDTLTDKQTHTHTHTHTHSHTHTHTRQTWVSKEWRVSVTHLTHTLPSSVSVPRVVETTSSISYDNARLALWVVAQPDTRDRVDWSLDESKTWKTTAPGYTHAPIAHSKQR